MTIAKYKFFWIMVIFSVFYILFSIIASIVTSVDQDYAASLPADEKTSIFGSIFGNIVLGGIFAIYYAVTWKKLEFKHSLDTVRPTEFLSVKTSKVLVVIKCALLGLLTFITFKSFYDYEFVNVAVFIFQMLSFACFVISVFGNLSLWNAINRSTPQKRL